MPIDVERLKTIETKDIKEIIILKGVEASALYGAIGAKNGVLLIFSKKEKKRKEFIKSDKVQRTYNESLIEYHSTKNSYLQQQELIYLAIQNALLSDTELNRLKTELWRFEKEIKSAESSLNLFNKILEKEEKVKFKFKEFDELKSYEKSLKFKEGFYSPRDFYVPKFSCKDSLITRFDFRNTVYWNPKIQTNKNGKATIQFFTSDAITTFRATLEGLGNSGKIGRTEHYFYSQPNLSLQIKIPANLMTGDLVKIPVTISNNSANLMEGTLSQSLPKGMTFLENMGLNTSLLAKETKTIFLHYQIEKEAANGNFGLSIQARNGEKDALFEAINFSSRGFPVETIFAGNLLEETFEIPIINPIKGSLNASFTVYPNIVGEVVDGMEKMLRQPTGCFEQTSSANYPNVLVLNYLQEIGVAMPEIEKKAMNLLEKGYKRLLGFEVTGGGFDWYGKPPAYEGLTAYGLMEFVDMSKVFQVDPALIKRTANWLLSRKNGKGSWARSKRALHSWNANKIGDAYICWAMSEADFGHKIKSEIEFAYQNAIESADSYLLGLLLNVFEKEQMDKQKISDLKSKLIALQNEDGSWTGKTTSITNSRGKNLTIETTALVVLGFIKNGQKNEIEKAINFLKKSKTPNGFGSTQSTILAMKALIEFAKGSKSFKENGTIALFINNKKIASESYEANQKEEINFDNLDQYLAKEKNIVKVKFSDTEQALPYDLAINYTTREPENSEICWVDLETKLAQKSIKMGEIVRFSIILTNTKNEAIPNTIAIIGIPAGLSLQPWQLKEMQEKAIFDYYEIMPNGYIAFHYRGMEMAEQITINLDLKADIPGIFEAPASSAYLYYWNEEKVWSKPERVEVK